MSFSEALGYPFKSENFLKIFPLAIITSIFFVLYTYSNNALLQVGGLIGSFVFSLALLGYYISIIQQVHDDATLEDMQVKRDVGRGCMTYIATLVYMIPAILLMVVIVIPFVVIAPANDGSASPLLALLITIVMLMLFIVASIIFGLAFFVGLNRYAADGTTQGLFAFGENVGIARRNIGTGMGLIGRLIALGFIYFCINAILMIFGGFAFASAYDPFRTPTTGAMLGAGIFQVISMTISLFMIVSQYHLIARYGQALGIGFGKRKLEAIAQDQGWMKWLALIFIIVLALLILGFFMFTMVLAPSIDATFMEIQAGFSQR